LRKKIIFDVGHPAQIHQFKHLYWLLEDEGWEGLFAAKDKEITIDLLEKYGLAYKVIGKSEKGIIKKISKLPLQIIRFNKIVKDFKPDFILSRFSIHAAYVAKLKGIINIGFADTEHTSIMDSISKPMINYKLTGYSYEKEFKKNHIRYHANIELFYLHPKLFVPDTSILDYLGVKQNEKFVIVRFVSWDAHHDVGHKGLSPEFKKELVNEMSQHARVYITSEQKLPPDLEPFRIQIPVEKIHDALSFAHLYIGEGGTMASEAACLGTPSIYINELDMGYIKEEAGFGLLFNHQDSKGVLDEALAILQDDTAKKKAKIKFEKFLSKQVNVTELVTWFLTNYPESAKIMQENPDYQYRFK